MTLTGRVLMLLLTFGGCLHAPTASASMPCPRPPCDPSAQDRLDALQKCELAADWVVEGEVASVVHGTKQMGELRPRRIVDNADGTFSVRQDVAQVTLWDGGQVVLTRIQVLKGMAPATKRQMTVQAATHCWLQQARIPEGQVGRRIRVYGTDNEWTTSTVSSAQTTPGIFAATALDARGNPVAFY